MKYKVNMYKPSWCSLCLWAGIILCLAGVPGVVCILSLIPINAQYGCLSQQFFAREDLSFYLLPSAWCVPFGVGMIISWKFNVYGRGRRNDES